MAPMLTCPDEHELLRIAMGEPVDPALLERVDGCSTCRARVERLRAEVASLVVSFDDGVKSPSTEPDPAVNPDGEPSSGGTTLDWAADPAGITAPEPLGAEAVAEA